MKTIHGMGSITHFFHSQLFAPLLLPNCRTNQLFATGPVRGWVYCTAMPNYKSFPP